MKVLVACENSGTVRDAFIRAGHDAWSCDLLPSEGKYVNRHIQDDIANVLRFTETALGVPAVGYTLPNGVIVWPDGWDLLIAHPDCTYLCSSGPHWNNRVQGRNEQTEEAIQFVRNLMNAPIHRIAIENPVGRIGTAIRKSDQYIQPYQFGHDASKKTGLRLKGLPPLRPTKFIEPRWVCGCGYTFESGEYDTVGKYGCPNCMEEHQPKPRWANQTDSGQNRLGPSADRWKERAKTYEGIAQAMADQWGRT